MPTWFWILFWWLSFGGTHIGLSSQKPRQFLIARFGERGFRAFYSLISFLTFVPLLRVYFAGRHSGPELWALQSGSGLRYTAIAVSALAVAVLIAGFLQPSPVGLAPASPQPYGITRITRHPMFCAFGLWGVGHVLVNGHLGDVLFFGGFVVFSLVGAAHQDWRKQGEETETLGQFYAQTSLLPFMAVLAGRNRIVVEEIPWLGLLVGIVAAAAIYLLHPHFFGG